MWQGGTSSPQRGVGQKERPQWGSSGDRRSQCFATCKGLFTPTLQMRKLSSGSREDLLLLQTLPPGQHGL
jgi:hypothetical protein